MLYREIAPVSQEAWDEIDEQAEAVIRSYLSARRVVKVNGPKGLDYNVITEGRLENIENKDTDEVCYGRYEVLPLVEARIEFDMNRWELDNVKRGAKDVDYEPLEKAAEKIALFEEDVIYNGLKKVSVDGLKNASEVEPIIMGKDLDSILNSLSQGLIKQREAYQTGPFDLVLGKELYTRILSVNSAYPFDKRIEELIGGKIVYNHIIDGGYLLPHDHEDLELTIGRDFSIGYQSHTNNSVRFFITESFTFRVLDPDIVVTFNS